MTHPDRQSVVHLLSGDLMAQDAFEPWRQGEQSFEDVLCTIVTKLYLENQRLHRKLSYALDRLGRQ